MFGLPVLVYSFTFLCNDVSGCPAPSLLHPSTVTLDQLKAEVGWPKGGFADFYDTSVTLWVLGYYLLSLAMYVFLPGQEVEGTELACGGRLPYKFNGWFLQLTRICLSNTPCSFSVGRPDPLRLCDRHLHLRRGLCCLDFSLGQLSAGNHRQPGDLYCHLHLRLCEELHCSCPWAAKP